MQNNNSSAVIISALLLAIATPSRGAAITYFSASQAATALAHRPFSFVNPVTDHQELNEPISANLNALAQVFWDSPNPLFSQATARVVSSFDENAVSARCEVRGGSRSTGGGSASESGGGALFSTEFFVDAPQQDFRFTANLRNTGFSYPHVWEVRLEGPSGVLVSYSNATSGVYYPNLIDVIRPAERGLYRMQLSVSGQSNYPFGSIFDPVFEASFIIPTPSAFALAGAWAAIGLRRRR